MSDEVRISNVNIQIFPQIIAAAIKLKEDDLYVLWLCFKAIDVAFGASGYMQKSLMVDLASWVLGCKTTQIYARINKGEGLYWGKFAGKKGEKATSLFSVNKVIEHLSPDMTRSEAFEISLSDICRHTKANENGEIFPIAGNWKRLHSLFISMVAGRMVDLRPTSYSTICSQTGLSGSTVFRNIKKCKQVKVTPNISPILVDSDRNLLEQKKKILDAESKKFLTIVQKSQHQYMLLERIPNSYEITGYERLPIKKRPKILKKYDAANSADVPPKIYHIDKPLTKEQNVQYVFRGEKISNNKGQVLAIWEQNRRII